MQLAQEKLIANYDSLSQERDKDIEAGNIEIDSEFLLHLREAHLITNQLIWLKTLSSNLRKVTFKYKAVFRLNISIKSFVICTVTTEIALENTSFFTAHHWRRHHSLTRREL